MERTVSDLAFITDGTAAAIFFIAGLVDAGVNHCPNEGCFAKNEVTAYNSFAVGTTHFQENEVGGEFYFRRETAHADGPFQRVWSVSASSDGELWAGIGHAYTVSNRRDNLFLTLNAMTGLYEEGSGVDLGGPIEFRSGIEVGYKNKQGVKMSLSVDHRSNLGIYSDNPGLETVQFRVSIPTK